MFRSRKISLFVLAGLLLVAGATLAPSHALADGRSGDIYTATLYYAQNGQWVAYNTYFVTYYSDGSVDWGGADEGYENLTNAGYSVTYSYAFWRHTDNG